MINTMELRKAGQAIFIAVEEPVAKDISKKLIAAADEIDALRDFAIWMTACEYDFYKSFYEENRVRLLQYENLRKHFRLMVNDVLGNGYYNMAMDVYEADRICCKDITRMANRSAIERLFHT